MVRVPEGPWVGVVFVTIVQQVGMVEVNRICCKAVQKKERAVNARRGFTARLLGCPVVFLAPKASTKTLREETNANHALPVVIPIIIPPVPRLALWSVCIVPLVPTHRVAWSRRAQNVQQANQAPPKKIPSTNVCRVSLAITNQQPERHRARSAKLGCMLQSRDSPIVSNAPKDTAAAIKKKEEQAVRYALRVRTLQTRGKKVAVFVVWERPMGIQGALLRRSVKVVLLGSFHRIKGWQCAANVEREPFQRQPGTTNVKVVRVANS